MPLPGPASLTEQAVFGLGSAEEIASLVSAYVRTRLGASVDHVVFRSGRIDAVQGVGLDDGRSVVVKAYRRPVDLEGRRVAGEAQRALAAAGFPCPEPLAGPDEFRGLVLGVESMAPAGEPVDGRDPEVRRALATGLHDQVEILRTVPGLASRAGPGSAWCRYQRGPWPEAHVADLDLSRTPPGFGWLDGLARTASDAILAGRDGEEVVVGHDDWYAGNTSFVGGRLAGSFDWQLVADTEPVLAGFTAAMYASSASAGGGLSTPAEAVAFLVDHEQARGETFDGRQRRVVGAAAAWTLAFSARCALCTLVGEPAPGSSLALLAEHGEEYLDLQWS